MVPDAFRPIVSLQVARHFQTRRQSHPRLLDVALYLLAQLLLGLMIFADYLCETNE
jgi:hypothetical protein